MAVYEIIPRSMQLHFDDVVDTLAANGGTGLTSADASSLFTKEANIKWDSKRKPVILAEYFPNYNGNWWKGTDGWCGLNAEDAKFVGDSNGLWDTLSSKIDGKMNGWRYVPPVGGASSPYRIADFEGYYTKANMVPSFVIDKDASNLMSGYMGVSISESNDADHTLSFSDLPIKNYYLGAILTKGTNKVIQTNSRPISEVKRLDISTESIAEGDWSVMLFLSENAITKRNDKDSDVFSTFYTIPNTSLGLVKISGGTTVIVDVTAVKKDPFEVSVQFTVTNRGASNLRFSANTVQLRYNTSDAKDSLLTEEMSQSLGEFTVNSGTTYTSPEIKFTEIQFLLYNNCKVIVTLNDKSIIKEVLL